MTSLLNFQNTKDNTLSKIIKSRSFNEKIIKHNKLFVQVDNNLINNFIDILKNRIKKLFNIPIINKLPNISDYTINFIEENLRVRQEGDFITIQVSWENPEEASRIANSYAVILRNHLENEQEESINYQLKNLYKTLGVFENDINSYLDKLNEYININKTLNPSIEIEEVNKLIANFKIKILENRVEMASLNKNSTKYSMLKEKIIYFR